VDFRLNLNDEFKENSLPEGDLALLVVGGGSAGAGATSYLAFSSRSDISSSPSSRKFVMMVMALRSTAFFFACHSSPTTPASKVNDVYENYIVFSLKHRN